MQSRGVGTMWLKLPPDVHAKLASSLRNVSHRRPPIPITSPSRCSRQHNPWIMKYALAAAFRGIYHQWSMIFALLYMACLPYQSWKILLSAAQCVSTERRAGIRSKGRGHSEQHRPRYRHKKSAQRCQICFPRSLGVCVAYNCQYQHGVGRGMAIRNKPTTMPLWRLKPTLLFIPRELENSIPI